MCCWTNDLSHPSPPSVLFFIPTINAQVKSPQEDQQRLRRRVQLSWLVGERQNKAYLQTFQISSCFAQVAPNVDGKLPL